MKNIIIKDLYLLKRRKLYIFIILVHLFLKLSHYDNSNEFYYQELILSTSLLIIFFLNYDIFNNVLNSLPVTRKKIIISKFIFLNLSIAFMTVFIYIICYLIHLINPNIIVIMFNLKDIISLILLPNIIMVIEIDTSITGSPVIPTISSIFTFSVLSNLHRYPVIIDSLASLTPFKTCLFSLLIYYLINKSVKSFERSDMS